MTVLHTVRLCTIIFVLSCFVALSNLWYFFFLVKSFSLKSLSCFVDLNIPQLFFFFLVKNLKEFFSVAYINL